MKKTDIALARILLLAGVIALNGLILLVFIGENEFVHIINNMNSNVYELSNEQMSLYNLYYYTAFNAIYKPLFSITIVLVIVSVASVLLRFGKAGELALYANIMLLFTGILLVLARFFEGSVKVHYYIDLLYMDVSSPQSIETVFLLDRIPLLYIAVIVLALIGLLLVRSSSIRKLKLYTVANQTLGSSIRFIIPALYGYIFMELLRGIFIGISAERMDSSNSLAYQYLNDYYIADRMFVSWSCAFILAIVVVINMLLNHFQIKNLINIMTGLAIPAAFTVVAAFIMAKRIPTVFGVLTTDIGVCDIADMTYDLFIISKATMLICLFCIIWSVVNRIIPGAWLMLILATNAVASVLALAITAFADNISRMYAGCIIADVLTAIVTAMLILYASGMKRSK